MMLLHRHRLATLIELSALERTVRGPERMLREEDVAQLIKAAYDDATEAARAEFMARVKPMPTSAWPWSAVQALGPRIGAISGTIGGVVVAPRPGVPTTPALLVLLRGQAEVLDADPGHRLPARETTEGLAWEPLYRALDTWDTATITAWMGPTGWINRAGVMSGQVPAGTGTNAGTGNNTGTGAGTDNSSGTSTNTGTAVSPDGGPGPAEPPAAFSWKHPAVIAAGASMASTIGVLLFSRRRRWAPVQEPS